MRSLTLAIVVLLAIVRPAHAETATELVAHAQAQWDNLEYDAVLALTQQALVAPDLTPKQRLEALRLEGFALVVLERRDDATQVFLQLFALDPEYQLPPKSSPRLLEVFEPARAQWQVTEKRRLATELGPALRALVLHVHLPASQRGGLPIEIGVDVDDPNAIADRIVLAQRRRGTTYYTTSEQRAHAGHLAFTIAGEDTASPEPYVLQLRVVAKHRSGVELTGEGTAEHPLELAVAAGSVPTPTPITHRWWFWTGIVVVAVGSGFLIDRVISVGPQNVIAQ